MTIAHEYNHILQFGYDAYEDPWFAESTAVWMEDQVYNGIDDYLRYVRSWTHLWRTPLTASSYKEYGSAVWNEWLAHQYGRGIVRDAWAGAGKTHPEGFAVAAYERAIRAAGNSTFGRDFTRFAADVSEWRTGTGFRESYLYPDMPRQGTLALGAPPATRRLNHTTFSLLGVHAPTGRVLEVRLAAPEGVAAGLALVGRIGSETDGRTVKAIDYAEAGGELTATLPDPGRFQRITAVVVNADARAAGFSAKHLDWRYLTDEVPFRVSARVLRYAGQDGPWAASCRPDGLGPRKLSPGEGTGAVIVCPSRKTVAQPGRPQGSGPGSRSLSGGAHDPRAWAGQGTGRLVHGPGRLWPWPRRPGVRGVEGSSREGHGRASAPSRKRHGSVTEVGPGDEDAGKSTLPRAFFRRCEHVTVVKGPYRGQNSTQRVSEARNRPPEGL